MVSRIFVMMTIFSTLYCKANAQEHKNSLFLELGGNAYVFSINYERVLLPHLSFRAGVGGLFGFVSAPMVVNYYVGKFNHKAEIGMGIAPYSSSLSGFDSDSGLLPIGCFGYRYQNKDGLLLRINYTPAIVKSNGKNKFESWGGISIGFCF